MKDQQDELRTEDAGPEMDAKQCSSFFLNHQQVLISLLEKWSITNTCRDPVWIANMDTYRTTPIADKLA